MADAQKLTGKRDSLPYNRLPRGRTPGLGRGTGTDAKKKGDQNPERHRVDFSSGAMR